MKYIILIMLVFSSARAYSQCDCMQAAAASASAMIGGTPDIGVLPEGGFRAGSYYRYISGGAEYDDGGSLYEMTYYSKYVGFSAAYGVSDKFTLEAESGWFSENGDFGLGAYDRSGFSHIALSGKYNIISAEDYAIEWTAGAGAKLPLQNIEEFSYGYDLGVFSTYYGAIIHSYLQKKFENGIRLFLISRFDFNFEDADEELKNPINVYRNSLYLMKDFWRDMFAAIEFRSVFSKGTYFYIAPQLGFKRGEFSASGVIDIPLYEHSDDIQLDIKTSFAVSLSWQPDWEE